MTTNLPTNLTAVEAARVTELRRIADLADVIEQATAELRTLAGHPAPRPVDGDGPARSGLDEVDLLRGFCDHVATHPHLAETTNGLRVDTASGDHPAALRGQVYPWHDRYGGRHLAVLTEWVDSLDEATNVVVAMGGEDKVHLRVAGRMTGGLMLHLVAVVGVAELPADVDTFPRRERAVWPLDALLDHTRGAAQ